MLILRLVWRRFLEWVCPIASEVVAGLRLALKSGRQLYGLLLWRGGGRVLARRDRPGGERRRWVERPNEFYSNLMMPH